MSNEEVVEAVCQQDTDGDGVSDAVEEYLGADPRDPCSPCHCRETEVLYPSGGGGCGALNLTAASALALAVFLMRRGRRHSVAKSKPVV